MTAAAGAHPDRRGVLSIVRGSETLKLALYELGGGFERRLFDGGIERLGAPGAELRIRDERGAYPMERRRRVDGGASPVALVLTVLEEFGIAVDAVGHRLVYGGAAHEPARVSAELLARLAELLPSDPPSLPGALDAIREFAAALPRIGHVVCFDTLPLPRGAFGAAARPYGFPALAYESIVRELGPAGTRGAMVIAHLGGVASLAATRNGIPVDATAGFSALGGVRRAMRPGELDPGALLDLLRGGRYTDRELDTILRHHRGLLGGLPLAGDMRTLLDKRGTDAAAGDAVELFVHIAKKRVGALVANLGRLDTLVFTGGIGERYAAMRAEICAGLDDLGIELDAERNEAAAAVISSDRSRVVVRVMAANESLMVARHTYDVLFAPAVDRAPPPPLLAGAGLS